MCQDLHEVNERMINAQVKRIFEWKRNECLRIKAFHILTKHKSHFEITDKFNIFTSHLVQLTSYNALFKGIYNLVE